MSQAIIDAVLMKQGVDTARKTLAERGIAVPRNALRDRIRYLNTTGQRIPLHKADADDLEAEACDAALGSRNLLDACLALYRRRAATSGLSVQDTMLFMLNAPERLAA